MDIQETLQAEFANTSGFSTTNLWYMKKWYVFYAGEIGTEKRQRLVGEIIAAFEKDAGIKKLQRFVGEIPFPETFGYVPWGQHIDIITKCKSIDEALFYIKKTIQNGYSRSAPKNVMAEDYHHTSGAAITNYSERLPLPQAQLAQEITKNYSDLVTVVGSMAEVHVGSVLSIEDR